MKVLQNLIRLLIVVLVLAVVAAGLAFVPDVQTWLAQRAFSRRANLKVSLGSVWARFGKLEGEDVRIEFPGGILTVPSLETELPVIPAARGQKIAFRRVVAKGWTLDFRGLPPELVAPSDAPPTPAPDASAPTDSTSAPAQPAPGPAETMALKFTGVLSGWALPWDFSADAIELEGDVLLPATADAEGARLHVTISGTGVGVGRKSALTLVVGGSVPAAKISNLTAKGEFLVAMDTPRTFSIVEWKPAVNATAGAPAKPLDAALDLKVARISAEETYSAALINGDRHLVALQAHFRDGSFVGSWETDLRNGDLVPFLPETPLPFSVGRGHGEFDATADFVRAHLAGDLRLNFTDNATGGSWDALRNAALDTRFDLVRDADTIHVAQLSASLGGERPLASLRALQPFDINLQTTTVVPTAPASDWAHGSIAALPLSTFAGLTGAWKVSGDDLSGDFTLKMLDGGVSVRAKKPVLLHHVTLQHDGADFARDLELSLALSGETSPKGWNVHATPLIIGQMGKSAATVEVNVSRPRDANFPWTIETKGHANLADLVAQPGFAKVREFGVSAISGNLTTTIGQWIHFAGDVTLTQQDAQHTVSAKLNADVRNDQSIAFRIPLTLTQGTTVAELTTEGKWLHGKYGHEISASVASKNLDVDSLHALGPLLAPLVRAEADQPISTSQFGQTARSNEKPDTKDRVPFWGDAFGQVTFTVETLKLGDSELKDVHGTLKVDSKSLQLEHTLYQLSNHLAAADAAITFDPAADARYHVTGAFDDGEIDAEPLFGPPPAGEDPPFHGRLSAASTLKGEGSTLDELLAQTRQEFRLKSTSGIVRLLKTHVAGVTQQKESKIADAAGVVGDLFGKVAGVQKNSIRTGEIKLNKNTDAVIDFSYDCGEIGYSELTITAARGLDGALHVLDVSMISPDAHITGKGEIRYTKGASPVKEPLDAELRFAVRDKTAELLAGTGLLSTEKDALGYTLFKRSFRITGTLQHPDVTAWHDLLYDAAIKSAEPKKK